MCIIYYILRTIKEEVLYTLLILIKHFVRQFVKNCTGIARRQIYELCDQQFKEEFVGDAEVLALQHKHIKELAK